MGLSDWLKTQAAAMAIALSSVEKNALGQKGENLESESGTHQRLNQGRLSDDLLRGELTQQVKELRWRTYKVLKEADKYITKSAPVYQEGKEPVKKYDDEGNLIEVVDGVVDGYTNVTVKVENKGEKDVAKLSLDPFDTYPAELCVINDVIVKDVLKAFMNEFMEKKLKPEIYVDEKTGETRATHGEIKSDYFDMSDNQKPLFVEREYRPRIELERFTQRMIVRKINEKERLLEFYISKYPNEYDKRTSLVVSECKKIIDGRRSDMTDLYKVGFISLETIGVPDYFEYQYDNIKFERIVEHDGNYILKFRANVLVNGEDILKDMVEEDLDERYKNKEAK